MRRISTLLINKESRVLPRISVQLKLQDGHSRSGQIQRSLIIISLSGFVSYTPIPITPLASHARECSETVTSITTQAAATEGLSLITLFPCAAIGFAIRPILLSSEYPNALAKSIFLDEYVDVQSVYATQDEPPGQTATAPPIAHACPEGQSASV